PGNDDFELIFDSQSTPKQTGADYANPATTAIAAKAYIKHGIKPANPKSYRFVVAPSTTAEQMTALANRIGNDGGDLFTIHAQSSTLHAVTYKPSNATAYAFFAPMAEVPFGIVRSVTSQLLLMDKPDASGRHHFAACNPDLKPVNSSLYGWLSTATTASLTLNGEWIPVVPVDGVAFSTPSAGKTQIDLSLQDGMSLYFGVKTPDDTQITDILAPERILFSKTENSLRLNLPAIENDRLHVAIYNISGNVLYRQNAIDGKNVEIPLHGLSQGLLVCVVSGGNKTETYKFIH
ncbi:MAG: T9SS type A sorting domain-containing protein, partial [Dysgonamonadaceae bacterium]|nr:T9SS type A sorting domain-containing protein [Dysgonamonadaceae bacterium]